MLPPPRRPLLLNHPRPLIDTPIQSTGPAVSLLRRLRLLALLPATLPAPIPLPIHQQVIQPETQQRKPITLQILRILSAQIHRSRNARHDGHLVRIDQRPGTREPHAASPLQKHQPRHHEGVVRPAVAQLVPPVLAKDLGRLDLVVAPQVRVARLVQENGLEDVVFERHVLWELRLVVGRVEAHFQLRLVLRVHFDVVHGAEVLFGPGDAGHLVVFA